MRKLLLPFVAVVLTAKLFAVTPVPYAEAVGFSLRVPGGSSTITMTVYEESAASPAVSVSGSSGTTTESGFGDALLKPNKIYLLAVAGNSAASYSMSFIAPTGYTLLVDHIPTNLLGITVGATPIYNVHTLELRQASGFRGAALGAFSGVSFGSAIEFSIGLGSLRNGRSAGEISFREKDFANGPAARARLFYNTPSNYGEVNVVRDSNQALLQVGVPQGFIDIVDETGGPPGYTFKFYLYSQVQAPPAGSGNPWIIVPGSVPWKTIRIQVTSAGNQLIVTEKEN